MTKPRSTCRRQLSSCHGRVSWKNVSRLGVLMAVMLLSGPDIHAASNKYQDYRPANPIAPTNMQECEDLKRAYEQLWRSAYEAWSANNRCHIDQYIRITTPKCQYGGGEATLCPAAAGDQREMDALMCGKYAAVEQCQTAVSAYKRKRQSDEAAKQREEEIRHQQQQAANERAKRAAQQQQTRQQEQHTQQQRSSYYDDGKCAADENPCQRGASTQPAPESSPSPAWKQSVVDQSQQRINQLSQVQAAAGEGTRTGMETGRRMAESQASSDALSALAGWKAPQAYGSVGDVATPDGRADSVPALVDPFVPDRHAPSGDATPLVDPFAATAGAGGVGPPDGLGQSGHSAQTIPTGDCHALFDARDHILDETSRLLSHSRVVIIAIDKLDRLVQGFSTPWWASPGAGKVALAVKEAIVIIQVALPELQEGEQLIADAVGQAIDGVLWAADPSGAPPPPPGSHSNPLLDTLKNLNDWNEITKGKGEVEEYVRDARRALSQYSDESHALTVRLQTLSGQGGELSQRIATECPADRVYH